MIDIAAARSLYTSHFLYLWNLKAGCPPLLITYSYGLSLPLLSPKKTDTFITENQLFIASSSNFSGTEYFMKKHLCESIIHAL